MAEFEMPTINGFVAECELCDEASVPPTEDFRQERWKKGFCAAHTPSETPVVAVAVKKPHAEWAIAKEMLPALLPRTGPTRQLPNPNHWGYAGAKAAWPPLLEMTEAEFDAAIATATTRTFT